MSKHTEGPWIRELNYFGDQIEITAGSREGRVEIAAVQVGYDEPFESEQIANAHLIAAAPDLLEALEAVLEMGYRDEPDVWGLVHAAIAKAKGKGND